MTEQQQSLSQDPPTALNILIMAAGLGTRMRSQTAKVLHNLGGRPLIAHVCRTALALNPAHIVVVVGHQADAVEQAVVREVGADKASFVLQREQKGTGDAVLAASSLLQNTESTLLVLSGDVPLVRAETLAGLVHQHRTHRGRGAACSILTVKVDDPTGYGRLVRGLDGLFQKIVEHKDANQEERQINEINSGIYCFDTRLLFPALARIQPANAQGEYYLTDVPSILRSDGASVALHLHNDPREISGINTRADLAEFEHILRRRTIRRHMLESGVTFIDPANTYIGLDAELGRDTIIYPNVSIEGKSVVGESCVLRSGSRITNSRLGAAVTIKDNCVVEDSEVGANCTVGPFAHLRMGSKLEESAAVGNFVEMKKSTLGQKSKSMHLTYLGDATIGSGTNIGAGTITCNYDGKNKHATVIEDNVKIGSNTMLVAPVRVGAGAVTGAGSVVTNDVEANTLVVGVPARMKRKLNE